MVGERKIAHHQLNQDSSRDTGFSGNALKLQFVFLLDRIPETRGRLSGVAGQSGLSHTENVNAACRGESTFIGRVGVSGEQSWRGLNAPFIPEALTGGRRWGSGLPKQVGDGGA